MPGAGAAVGPLCCPLPLLHAVPDSCESTGPPGCLGTHSKANRRTFGVWGAEEEPGGTKQSGKSCEVWQRQHGD